MSNSSTKTLKHSSTKIGKMLNALELVAPALAGKLAFQFFCSPRRLPIRPQDATFLATAQQEFFQVKNLRISAYTWTATTPNGTSALLLHGWESNSARWKKYVKGLLEAGFTVHAIDAPASGHSQGTRLNVLLLSAVMKSFVELKGAPHIVVGHSLGGAAAVMSTSILGAPLPQKMVLMGVFAETRRVTHDFVKIIGANDRVVESIFREVEKRSGMPIDAYSVAQKVTTLRDVKGLVVHDRDDNVAPVTEGRLIAESWGATMLETEGLGHRLQDKSVVKAVVEFALQP